MSSAGIFRIYILPYVQGLWLTEITKTHALEAIDALVARGRGPMAAKVRQVCKKWSLVSECHELPCGAGNVRVDSATAERSANTPSPGAKLKSTSGAESAPRVSLGEASDERRDPRVDAAPAARAAAAPQRLPTTRAAGRSTPTGSSSADGSETAINAMEFDMLRVFALNPSKVLTRDRILDLARPRHGTFRTRGFTRIRSNAAKASI